MNFLVVTFPDYDFETAVLNAVNTISSNLTEPGFNIHNVNIAQLVVAKFIEDCALNGRDYYQSSCTYIQENIKTQVTAKLEYTDLDVAYALDLHTGDISHVGYC